MQFHLTLYTRLTLLLMLCIIFLKLDSQGIFLYFNFLCLPHSITKIILRDTNIHTVCKHYSGSSVIPTRRAHRREIKTKFDIERITKISFCILVFKALNGDR